MYIDNNDECSSVANEWRLLYVRRNPHDWNVDTCNIWSNNYIVPGCTMAANVLIAILTSRIFPQ
jgi:hypothetical protein